MWYHQRAAVTDQDSLPRVMEHNRDEEMEHSAMLIEWLRRCFPGLEEQLKTLPVYGSPDRRGRGRRGRLRNPMQKRTGPLRAASTWLITFLVATAILLVLVLTNIAPTMTPTLKIMLVISFALVVGIGGAVFFRTRPKTNKRDVEP